MDRWIDREIDTVLYRINCLYLEAEVEPEGGSEGVTQHRDGNPGDAEAARLAGTARTAPAPPEMQGSLQVASPRREPPEMPGSLHQRFGNPGNTSKSPI